MIYFSLSSYYKNIFKQFSFAEFEFKSYDDGENYIKLNTKITNQDCCIFSDISENSQLFKLTMLAETIQEQKPKSLTLILPYLAYSRQDKQNENETTGIIWLGKILKSVGIEKIVTIDIHSQKSSQLIGIPLTSLDAWPIFESELTSFKAETTVVAPDEGALARAKKFADSLKIQNIVSFKKSHIDGIYSELSSQITTSHAIIVDDILATGKTLVSTAKKLKEVGIKDIVVVVTHGLFRGNKWRELWQLGVKKILVSNSIDLPETVEQDSRVIICPIVDIIELKSIL